VCLKTYFAACFHINLFHWPDCQTHSKSLLNCSRNIAFKGNGGRIQLISKHPLIDYLKKPVLVAIAANKTLLRRKQAAIA
jgi:hypothetical protein